jgi:hypothetical protein
MPTPGGLPKAGEIWERTQRLPTDPQSHTTVFRVIERKPGSYWAIRVQVITIDGKPPRPPNDQPRLWVDASYWWSKGELRYLGTKEEYARRLQGSVTATMDQALAAAEEILAGVPPRLKGSAQRLKDAVLDLQRIQKEKS